MVEPLPSGGIKINLEREVDDSYRIEFGQNMFPRLASDLKSMFFNKRTGVVDKRFAIITDSEVKKLYAHDLGQALNEQDLWSDVFDFPAGDKHKTIETCMEIMGQMQALNYGRDSVLLALGGGVVTDLGGFTAAIYNRGIPFVPIPTTVLAQADSAVGGKTGVNTEYGKNLVGAFKQPALVCVDVATLESLPIRQHRSGLAETIKHGIIQDSEFFDWLKKNARGGYHKDPDFLMRIAKKNCTIKGNVVEQDTHEKGLRQILNYGHTVGHAIEKLSDYKLAHGEAISIGMMVAGRISMLLGYFPEAHLLVQEHLLTRVGLPTKIPEGFSFHEIIELTYRDKKAKNGMAHYVLPVRIGEMHPFDGAYARHVENDVVMKALVLTRANP